MMAALRHLIAARCASFYFAGRGIVYALQTEVNARIHLLASALVIVLGLICDIRAADWCWLLLAMSAVWALELLNSAIENVCDLLSPAYHQAVQHAKDLAAGAVLLAAVAATAVGALVFRPYLL